jgi:hypothetical protein
MTGAQAGAVVAVEVLIEQQIITPVGIGLEFGRASIDREPAVFIPEKDAGETVGNLLGYFEQVHQVAGGGWTLHL